MNAHLRSAPIAVGILGCSEIAVRRMLPTLAATSAARLVSIGSRDPASAEARAGVACRYETYEELLERSELELIYISLPNDLHEQWCIRALEHGKHVLCEKPLGLSAASIERMLGVAESANRLVYENIMYLHHPRYRTVRALLDNGEIGTLRALRTAFGFTLKRTNDFRLDRRRGGGAYHDLMRYPASAALHHLNGAMIALDGYSLVRDGLHIGMFGCALTDRHEQFQFSIGFEQQYENWIELIGTKGRIRLERAYTIPRDQKSGILLARETSTRMIEIPPTDHCRIMLEHVCDCLRSGSGWREIHDEIRQRAALAELAYAGCPPVDARPGTGDA